MVIGDREQLEIPTAQVPVGDLLPIRPGAKMPVQAIVEDSQSEVNESTVTGESLPVSTSAGSQLIGRLDQQERHPAD